MGGWLVQRFGFGALAFETVVLGIVLTLIAATALREPTRATLRRGAVTGVRGYASLVSRREVKLVAAVRFLPTIYWGTMTLLLPLLIYRLSQQVIVVSIYSAVSLMLAAACQIGTGRAVDRLGRTLPPIFLTALIPVCGVLAALSARDLTALFAVGVLGTCVAWSISATLPPLVREVAGAAEEGRVLGFLHLLWSAAMFGGTLLAGTLVEVDPALPFAVVAAVNGLTWLAALTLHRQTKARLKAALARRRDNTIPDGVSAADLARDTERILATRPGLDALRTSLCPSLARCVDVFADPRTGWTAAEVKHFRSCPYCFEVGAAMARASSRLARRSTPLEPQPLAPQTERSASLGERLSRAVRRILTSR